MTLSHHDLVTLLYETKSKARKGTYFIITDREKKVVQPFPFHKKELLCEFFNDSSRRFLIFCRKSSF